MMLDHKKELALKWFEWIAVASWVLVIGGFCGWVVETSIYKLMYEGYMEKRGSAIGPWIPIFGFGALLIVITTYKLRKRAWLTFLASALSCGLLEYITGWVLYYQLGGVRLWDYSAPEVFFGWGHIDGFVCPVSMAFFGIAALMLQYFVFPILAKLVQKIKHRWIVWLTTMPAVVFLIDVITFNLAKYVK